MTSAASRYDDDILTINVYQSMRENKQGTIVFFLSLFFVTRQSRSFLYSVARSSRKQGIKRGYSQLLGYRHADIESAKGLDGNSLLIFVSLCNAISVRENKCRHSSNVDEDTPKGTSVLQSDTPGNRTSRA